MNNVAISINEIS